MPFVYLAAPFSSPDRAEQIKRVHRASRAAAKLMQAGFIVHSPLSQGFPLEVHLPEEVYQNHAFWMKQSLGMLGRAGMLFLLPLEGWRKSSGVKEELAFAASELIPIRILQDSTTPDLDTDISPDDPYLSAFSPTWNFLEL